MECRFALLCETANKRTDHLVDATGLGCDRMTVTSLPASGSTTLVFAIEFDPAEAEMLNTSEIALVDPVGRVLSNLAGGFFPSWDGAVTSTQVVPYGPFTVTVEGRHWFVVSVGDEEVARVPLDVVLG